MNKLKEIILEVLWENEFERDIKKAISGLQLVLDTYAKNPKKAKAILRSVARTISTYREKL